MVSDMLGVDWRTNLFIYNDLINNKVRFMKKIGALACLMCPTLAFAHPGHTEVGFTSGFVHPFTGIDHLAVMFGLGLVCSVFFTKESANKWLVLSALGVSLGFGSALAIAGFKLPMLEMMIALSVVLVGALAIIGGLGRSINKWVVYGLSTMSAFHVYVHIIEGAAATIGHFGQYTMGFVLSSVTLYVGGLALGSKIVSVSMKPQVCIISGSFYVVLALVLGL